MRKEFASGDRRYDIVTATQTATTHERTHDTPNNTASSSMIAPLETLIYP
ncbi:hypothetical protein [Nostoc sp.]